MPEAISGWPPALGWWLLAALVLAVIGASVWLYKRLTRKTPVKTALKRLAVLRNDRLKDNAVKLGELSALLRRVAVSVDKRADVAGLTGYAWLDYLDKSVQGAPFRHGPGRCLADAHFRKSLPPDVVMPVLFELCETWFKAQRK